MPKINILPMYSDQGGPETLKRKLEAARLIMGDTNRTPEIYSTGQGLAHAGSKMLAGFLAGRAERENDQEEDAAWNPLQDLVTRDLESFGQGASATSPSSDPSQPRASYSAASSGVSSGDEVRARNSTAEANEQAKVAHATFTKLGYSPAAAAGIVGNLMEESGFNPGIVGDKGTAFGIAQWRGPRFANLQKFAQTRGKDWRDLDTQLHFVDHEMRNGLDAGASKAFAALQSARDPGEASDVFMRHYERPADWAIAQSGPRRAAVARRLIEQGVPAEQAVQTAYASGNAPAPARRGFDLPEFDLSAQRSKIAMASRMMQNRRTREAGFALYQQAIQEATAIQNKRIEYMMKWEEEQRRQDFEREKLDREDFRAEQDRDLKKDAGQLDREKFDHERNKPMVIGGSSRLVSPDGKVIVDANPQVGGEITLPDGTTVRTGPKLTEQQSKDVGFYERGASAELELREREEALTEFMSKNAGNLPAIGNYFKSPEYRQAEVPARNFLAAILRKDSGGAITAEEMQQYGGMFLPQPGDDRETIRLKRQARAAAIKSIKKGLGPAEALAEAYPKLFDGKSLEPKPQEDKKPHPEARRGTDGKWYRPDPSRPGKYLVLE